MPYKKNVYDLYGKIKTAHISVNRLLSFCLKKSIHQTFNFFNFNWDISHQVEWSASFLNHNIIF